MEILNHHHQLNQPGKVTFKYRLRDAAPNEQKYSATFDYYSISGNNLILTQLRYWDLEATDSLRDWKLINVDITDCDQEKLSRLINDSDMNELKIIETSCGKKLIAYSSTERYIFRCEEIEQEIRGYSRKEIVDMLVEKEEYINEVEIHNSNLYEFLIRLFRFVSGESRDHLNLIALNQEKNISQATKSMHCLEMLARVKDKFNDLKKSLLEESLEWRGLLS